MWGNCYFLSLCQDIPEIHAELSQINNNFTYLVNFWLVLQHNHRPFSWQEVQFLVVCQLIVLSCMLLGPRGLAAAILAPQSYSPVFWRGLLPFALPIREDLNHLVFSLNDVMIVILQLCKEQTFPITYLLVFQSVWMSSSCL